MTHTFLVYHPEPEENDDPKCVCGVYRSEHALCGCPEGFQSPESWEKERQAIRQQVWDDYYGDDREEY